MNHRKTTRFQSLTDAASFYKISRRGFFAFKAAGVKAGDPLPYDNPEEMPAWFERRGRPCPQSVLDQACAVATQAPASASPGRPAAKTVRARPPAPAAPRNGSTANGSTAAAPAGSPNPSVRITLDGETSLDSIRSGQRRLHAALARRYEQFILDGEQESPQALALYRRMVDLEGRILAWQKAAADLDRDEWMPLAEVQAAAREFASTVARLFRRHLPLEFGPMDHERIQAAVDRLAERLPQLLPEALKDAA